MLNEKKEDDIRKAIANYDDKKHPKGETLPSTTRLFRVKFVKAFLNSGTPLSRAEYFRDLFEEVGYPLTSSSNMRQLIPFILEQEYECICQEVKGKMLPSYLREMGKHWLFWFVLWNHGQ